MLANLVPYETLSQALKINKSLEDTVDDSLNGQQEVLLAIAQNEAANLSSSVGVLYIEGFLLIGDDLIEILPGTKMSIYDLQTTAEVKDCLIKTTVKIAQADKKAQDAVAAAETSQSTEKSIGMP